MSRRIGAFCLLLVLTSLSLTCGEVFDEPVTDSLTPEIDLQKAQRILDENPKWLPSNTVCPTEFRNEQVLDVDYTSYRCDRNPLHCLTKCQNEDGTACYGLALILQKKNEELADRLFLRACKFGDASGCTNNAAGRLKNAEKNSEQLDCIADSFEMSCEKNDPWGCTMFASLLIRGEGVEVDLQKALKALSKSCKYGLDDPACKKAKELKEEISQLKAKEVEQNK